MRQHELGFKSVQAAVANGVGKSVTIADAKKVAVMVTVTTAFTTGSLKFLGSIEDIDAVPNFAIAASKTNQITYLNYKKQLDQSNVAGGTPIDLSIAGTFLFLINDSDALTYMAPEISNITGVGEVTITISAYGDSN